MPSPDPPRPDPARPIDYVSTGQAARELGVAIRTLQHWVWAGLVEPDYRTAGGHMRWDVARVRAELTRNQPRARPRPEQA